METWERMERVILFSLTGTLSVIKTSNKTLHIGNNILLLSLHNEKHLV